MVSIIIPVYNVEKYLNQCIDSVTTQSYKNLEIILVDDGSTDDSGKICDEYLAKDNRIKIIHKDNGGLMAAWKSGFFSSRGEYVGFVDSDDWINIDMYEKLVSVATSEDADIVVCQLIKELEESSNVKIKEKLRLRSGVYNSERIREDIIPGIINDGTYFGRRLSPNRVTKLFRRELIENNIQFCDDTISLGEDLVACFSCLCDSEKIVILSDFYPYHYRIHNQSITGKYDNKRMEKVKNLHGKLQEIAKYKKINIFNISEQIANDYISSALLCVEAEILYSPFSKNRILKNVEKIYKSDFFSESLRDGCTKGFSMKHRWFLFLLKREKYGLLFYSRKNISSIKVFIKKMII